MNTLFKNKLLLIAPLIFFWSVNSHACVWVDVGNSTLECRTPYRQFFFGDSIRREMILNIALKNAQRKFHQILNERDVLALITESDVMYNVQNTQAIDDLIKQSEDILRVTNDITSGSNDYLREESPLSVFQDGTLSPYPSAYMVGFTVPFRSGIKLPFEKLIKKFSETLPNVEIGGGSIFFGAVLIPQMVEYVAKYSANNDFSNMTGRIVHMDVERNTRVYDVSALPSWDRLRFSDVEMRAFPTADIRVTTRTAPRIKASGLQPTVAFAWGDAIYRPSDVGTWGISYSLPTSLSRVPFSMATQATSPLAQGSILGHTALTARITWGLLRLLDMAHVETAKISWNSSDDLRTSFDNIEQGFNQIPFDQLIVNIRWGDFKNNRLVRESNELPPSDIISQARVGLNFGLSLTDVFDSSTMIISHILESLHLRIPDVTINLTPQERARVAVEQAEGRLFEQSLREVLATEFAQELLVGRSTGQGLSEEEINALQQEIQQRFIQRLQEETTAPVVAE